MVAIVLVIGSGPKCPRNPYYILLSGYSLFTHCSFDKTKNKLDYYRGEDCMKKFCLQSVTKTVRLAPPPPLFNVGCKFAYSLLVLAAWHGFFRLGTTLSQGEGGILCNFNQA